MFQKLLLALVLIAAVAVGSVLVMAGGQPDTLEVSRAHVIEAPASAITPYIVDFHQWRNWSPWDELDPDMERTYDGAESGVGATYAWQGNDQVGKGSMKILEVVPDEKVVIELRFIDPFESVAKTTFVLGANDEDDEGTEVTWTMTSANALPAKIMSLFMDMDAMIGKDFEKGLTKLEHAVEDAADAEEDAAEMPLEEPPVPDEVEDALADPEEEPDLDAPVEPEPAEPEDAEMADEEVDVIAEDELLEEPGADEELVDEFLPGDEFVGEPPEASEDSDEAETFDDSSEDEDSPIQ